MVTGLVHALHGVPPGDLQLRALAESVVQAAVFQPVAAALQDVHGLIAGGAAAQLAAVRTATWHLHAALRQLQALLNGLESYADGMPSCSDGGTAGDSCGPVAIESCAWADKEALARGVAAAAVAALLSCWPQLASSAWGCTNAFAPCSRRRTCCPLQAKARWALKCAASAPT